MVSSGRRPSPPSGEPSLPGAPSRMPQRAKAGLLTLRLQGSGPGRGAEASTVQVKLQGKVKASAHRGLGHPLGRRPVNPCAAGKLEQGRLVMVALLVWEAH